MKCRVQYVRLDLQIDAIISSAIVAVRKKYLHMRGYQSTTLQKSRSLAWQGNHRKELS